MEYQASSLNQNKIHCLPLPYYGIILAVSVFYIESNFILQAITKILRENDLKGFGKLATPKFLFKVRSEIPFSKSSYHTETSPLICKTNHLAGFYSKVFSNNECYFQTD